MDVLITTKKRSYRLGYYVVSVWCPELSYHFGYSIPLQWICDQIRSRFSLLKSHSAMANLKYLLDVLRKAHNFRHIQSRIQGHISDFFSQDLRAPRMQSLGLPSSRAMFVVVAAFANITRSNALAQILVDVFMNQGDVVVNHERTLNIFDWYIALDQLRGIVDPGHVDYCLRILLHRHSSVQNRYQQYNSMGRCNPQIEVLLDWMDHMLNKMGRGRNYNRTVAWPRSRTLPPPVRAPPMFIAAAPGWASAYSSPVLRPQNDPFRNAQIDDLQDRIDRLEYNRGMQLALPPPVPMALPWHT